MRCIAYGRVLGVLLWLSAAQGQASGIPFGSEIPTLPCTIAATDFDLGGEGVGYHVIGESRETGFYRPTEAEILVGSEFLGPGVPPNGYGVKLNQGEWLAYTVMVQQPGAYTVCIMRDPQGALERWPGETGGERWHVETEGEDRSGAVTGVGSWMAYFNEFGYYSGVVVLRAGRQTLRLVEDPYVSPPWNSPVSPTVRSLQFRPLPVRPVTVVAGDALPGNVDGPGKMARFSTNITGISCDSVGNVYVADAGNLRVRGVTPVGAVTTLAGNGSQGTNDGPGASARFSTLGWSSTRSTLPRVRSISVDADGDCYVLDPDPVEGRAKIRKISRGVVSTFWSDELKGRTMATLNALGAGELICMSYTNVPTFNPYIHYWIDLLGASTPPRPLVEWTQPDGWSGFSVLDVHAASSTEIYSTWLWHYHIGGIFEIQRWAGDVSGWWRTFSTYHAWLDRIARNRRGDMYYGGSLFVGGREATVIAVGEDGFMTGVLWNVKSDGPMALDDSGNLYTFSGSQLLSLPNRRGFLLNAFTRGGGSVNYGPAMQFESNTVVQVSATTTNAGWTFLGWRGDAGGTNASLAVTMDEDKAVEGVFGTTVSIDAAGGSVERNPALDLYPYGSELLLTAVPGPGSKFQSWEDGSTNAVRRVFVLEPIAIQASFITLPQYHMTATVASGGGTVGWEPAETNLHLGDQIEVYARPDTNRVFSAWTDGDLSNPRSITLLCDTNLTAIFTGGEGKAPEFTRVPAEATVLAGSRVRLVASAVGSSPVEYQWRHDGRDLPGAKEAELVLVSASSADNGIYTVIAHNSVGSIESSARLTVLVGVSPRIVEVKVVAGALQMTVHGSPGQRYQLEAASDLKVWQAMATVENPLGTVSSTVPLSPQWGFYRLSIVP